MLNRNKSGWVVLLLFVWSVSGFAAENAPRPNIIFILTDDQGYGDVAAHGHPILKTPVQDQLHAESVRFTDFHVSPTCSPTRSSLMSGKHEFKNGVTHTIYERERMSLKSTTLPQVLKTAGYTTGIFGKWHLGDEPAYQPEKRGFDEVYIHGGGGIGQSYPGTCGDVPGNKYFDPTIKHNGKFEKTSGFCTDIFTAQAIKWMDGARKNGPFFCYIPFNAAHEPLSCPLEFKKPYEGKGSDRLITYYGMIANIDLNVGLILKQLKDWNIEQQTLVIFMNDNGGTPFTTDVFNAGMRGSKVTPIQGGTRAISFWRWPGTLKPADCSKLTAHIDVFPTLAELAGATIPAGVKQDGFSLVPLLKNPDAEWHTDRFLFTHVGRWGGINEKAAPPRKLGACSVRWQQYEMAHEKGAWHLFDLKADPGEATDVAEKHPDIVEKLTKAYDAWWEEVLPMLENEDSWKTASKINPFKEEYEAQKVLK